MATRRPGRSPPRTETGEGAARVTLPDRPAGSRTVHPNPELFDLPARFDVRRVIGRGGMGVVFEAHDQKLGRDVAVKVLARDRQYDRASRARMLREARAAAALEHPGIVTVYDVDSERGFIVMELVRSESLDQLLRRGERPEVRQLARGILLPLAAAHRAGIVHRDIKPSNILIETDGSVRLADFGIASFGDSDLTLTSERIGTPGYMAPEQLRGQRAGAPADVYAAGATLFEVATGRKLHASDGEPIEVSRAVLDATGDASLAAVIARAVDERIAQRFADADELLAALRPPQRPRRAIAIGLTVSALALAAVAASAGTFDAARLHTSDHVARPARAAHTIALLPFSAADDQPSTITTAEALPHLLERELQRSRELGVITHYMLRDRVREKSPSAGDWSGTARSLGATLLVRGKVASNDHGVRVVVEVNALDGREVARYERETSADRLDEAIQQLAGEVAGTVSTSLPAPAGDATARAASTELALAIAALERHAVDDADQYLLKALARQPDLAEARYYHALLLWWMGRPDAELNPEIERALAGTLDDKKRGFLEALRYLIAHEHANAVEKFTALAARYPDDRDVLYGTFEALFHYGRGAEAVQIYERIVERWPRFRLGYIHPLTYYLTHGNEAGVRRLLARPGVVDESTRRVWLARAPLAAGDYKRALAEMQKVDEEGGAAGTPNLLYLMDDLVQAYAVTGQMDRAFAVAERGTANPAVTLGLAAATGDELAQRSWHTSFIRRINALGNANYRLLDLAMQLILFDISSSDASARRATALAAGLDTASPSSSPPESELARVFLLADDEAIRRARASAYTEVAAVGDALAAERAAKWNDAAAAWRRAVAASTDGRFWLAEWYGVARAERARGDGEATIAACREVITPRAFQWSWANAIGPCLAWTADAHAAAGRTVEAHATWQRLLDLRRRARRDDPLVTMAHQHATR